MCIYLCVVNNNFIKEQQKSKQKMAIHLLSLEQSLGKITLHEKCIVIRNGVKDLIAPAIGELCLCRTKTNLSDDKFIRITPKS